ncbi:MAG: molecular chaperone DnaK, partial [Candidatus Omnitrophota bacterium]
SLKDYGSKISDTDKENIEKEAAKLKETLKGKDLAAIKKGMEDLGKASHKLAEEVYKDAAAKQKQQGPSPKEAGPGKPEGETPEGGNKGEDIIDADYKVEGDDKKE